MHTSNTEQNTEMTDQSLRKKLAAIEHERWADWQKWVHKQLVVHEDKDGKPHWCLPPEAIDAWEAQIATSYENLSEREQASDMEQVERYWPLIKGYIETNYIEKLTPETKKRKCSDVHPDLETDAHGGFHE